MGEGWGLADAGLDSLTLMSPCLRQHMCGVDSVFARLDGKFSKKFHDREKKSEIPVQQQEF